MWSNRVMILKHCVRRPQFKGAAFCSSDTKGARNEKANPTVTDGKNSNESRSQKYSLHMLAGFTVLAGTVYAGKKLGFFTRPTSELSMSQDESSNKSNDQPETTSDDSDVTSISTPSPTSPSPALPPNLPVTHVDKMASPDLPESVPYLLVGAGTASFAAYRAIRGKDPKAKILIVGEENRLPYMRPPLSKEMWYSKLGEPQFEGDIRFNQWNGRTRSIFYEPPAFYLPFEKLMESRNGGVSILSGRKVVRVDATKQEVVLDNGKVIKYEKCLLATGGKPKVLPVLDVNPLITSKVSVFRTAEDFISLAEKADRMESIAVIGGGFLGSELACALGHKSKTSKLKVHQVFSENGNMGKVLPDYLSEWTMSKVRAENVNVIPNANVTSAFTNPKGKLVMNLSNNQQLEVDHVVMAIGISPNTELAKGSNLELDSTLKGYRVNAELEARSNLWVAGDAASFYDVILGRRRVEHHDHAVVSGRLAGENMVASALERKPYTHQSMFWSDLGPNIGYEAIGLVDSSLETVGVFAKASDKDTPKSVAMKSDEILRSDIKDDPKVSQEDALPTDLGKDDEKYGKGVIFYLKDKVVVGLVMWNMFGRMSTARKVIQDNKKYEDLTDLAKLFNVHDHKEEDQEGGEEN